MVRDRLTTDGQMDGKSDKIMLLEYNSIKTNKQEIAIIMNNFFINIKNLI